MGGIEMVGSIVFGIYFILYKYCMSKGKWKEHMKTENQCQRHKTGLPNK